MILSPKYRHLTDRVYAKQVVDPTVYWKRMTKCIRQSVSFFNEMSTALYERDATSKGITSYHLLRAMYCKIIARGEEAPLRVERQLDRALTPHDK